MAQKEAHETQPPPRHPPESPEPSPLVGGDPDVYGPRARTPHSGPWRWRLKRTRNARETLGMHAPGHHGRARFLEVPVKLVFRTLVALFALLALAGVAFAQEAAAAGADVASWFASTAALAAVVVAVVSFVKAHVLKKLHDLATVAVSLAVGAALGLAGSLLGYIEGGVGAGAAFGVAAGFLASGGWDAITGALGKRGSAG